MWYLQCALLFSVLGVLHLLHASHRLVLCGRRHRPLPPLQKPAQGRRRGHGSACGTVPGWCKLGDGSVVQRRPSVRRRVASVLNQWGPAVGPLPCERILRSGWRGLLSLNHQVSGPAPVSLLVSSLALTGSLLSRDESR